MPELSFRGDSQEGVLFQIRLESSIEVSSHRAPAGLALHTEGLQMSREFTIHTFTAWR